MPAEGQQARLVAADERLERAVVAAPDEGDEPLVGLQAQQRGGTPHAECCGMLES
jgi:hypothetical protein